MNRRHMLGGWRVAAIMFGGVVCAMAVAAPWLGLGEGPNFVFYRLLGVPRKTMCYLGIAVALAPIVSHRGFLTSLFPAATIKDEFSARARPLISPRVLFVLIAQLALAVVIAAAAFLLNRDNILSYIDGHYELTLSRNQAEFTAGQFGFSTNPLQGLGDLWFFTNTSWIPELSVSRLFSDPNWQVVAVQSLAFSELFVVTFLLAYWLYGSPAKAAASSWLAVLVIMPLTYPPLIYDILGDAPEHATLITLPLIIVLLWAGVGQGAPWADAIRVSVIGLLFWLHFVALGLFTALAYPFIAIAGVEGEPIRSQSVRQSASRCGTSSYLLLFPFTSPGAATRITPWSSRYKL